MIDRLADAGISIDRCCRVLGVARQHYYRVKRKPLTQSELRRQWLTGLIREVHVTSRGTYGYRRVHAELTMATGSPSAIRPYSSSCIKPGSTGSPARSGPNVFEASSRPMIS